MKIPTILCTRISKTNSERIANIMKSPNILQKQYFYPAARIINCPHNQAQYVPSAYPNTANSTPTGAKAGSTAEATTGAEAAPPIFA